jgi:hypothetical protein
MSDFLVDASLPRTTSDLLRRYGHQATDVRDIGLGTAPESRHCRSRPSTSALHHQHRPRFWQRAPISTCQLSWPGRDSPAEGSNGSHTAIVGGAVLERFEGHRQLVRPPGDCGARPLAMPAADLMACRTRHSGDIRNAHDPRRLVLLENGEKK